MLEAARSRVERLEEPVLDGDLRARERVQQRRLADVCSRRGRRWGPRRACAPCAARPVARAASSAAPAAARCGAAPCAGRSRAATRRGRGCRHRRRGARDAATSRASAAGCIELRELDLELPLGADRVLGEDVEDQLGPVDDPGRERILERTLLGRVELVVDDEQSIFR